MDLKAWSTVKSYTIKIKELKLDHLWYYIMVKTKVVPIQHNIYLINLLNT